MRVFIANFGRANYAWNDCRTHSTISTMNDAAAHGFWESRNRDAFIDYCIRHSKTAEGQTPTRPVASRWFNLMSIVSESVGDIWIHREHGELWWTKSLNEPPNFRQAQERQPNGAFKPIIVCDKPCAPWSDTNQFGARLTWTGLHPKAREFLFTEGTLQQLSGDNAEYALALVDGADLSHWHNLEQWRRKAEAAGRGEVTTADAKRRAAVRMAITAFSTTVRSNGQQELRTVKNKEFRFARQADLENYILSLIAMQDGLCAITSLRLQFDGEFDDHQMLASLDRIDSDGHYEEGNLQIVCKFVNRWKCDDENDEFRRLINLLRQAN